MSQTAYNILDGRDGTVPEREKKEMHKHKISSFWNVHIQDMIESESEPLSVHIDYPVCLGPGIWTERKNLTIAQRFFHSLLSLPGIGTGVVTKEAWDKNIINIDLRGNGQSKMDEIIASVMKSHGLPPTV